MFLENDIRSHPLMGMSQNFYDRNSNIKEINKRKIANSQQNFAGFFSAATDSEHKIIQILQRKGQNKIWTELSSLGQEPRIFRRKYSTKPCFDEVDIRPNDTSTKSLFDEMAQ